LDEYGIFFVFPLSIPSFKLLFVCFMPKNEERIHNNSHEEVLPHTLSHSIASSSYIVVRVSAQANKEGRSNNRYDTVVPQHGEDRRI
jgi:hypothetical protein